MTALMSDQEEDTADVICGRRLLIIFPWHTTGEINKQRRLVALSYWYTDPTKRNLSIYTMIYPSESLN